MRAETAIFVAFDDYRAFDPAEPEKNLMWAILRMAMDDLRRDGELHRDAKRYLLSQDSLYPFSFLNVCYHLNLSPRLIRSLVGLAHIEERLAA